MKIKRFTLLSLSIGVLSVATIVGFTNDRVSKYNQQTTSDELTGGDETIVGSAMDFIRSIKANISTGEVSYEEYAQARKQVKRNMLASNKSLDMGWEFMGPDNFGGRTRTMIIDMNDPNTIYAGSASGGIFVSTNGGDSWDSYSDNLENNAISSMVQAADGDIYFATGPIFDNPFGGVANKDIKSIFLGSGVYKLTGNGGVQNLASPTTGNSVTVDWAMSSKLAADPTDPNVIYVGTNNGLKYTDDGGLSWETVTGIDSTSVINDIEVASDGTVMVTLSNPGKLYTSTDKGLTFNEITNIPLTANDSRIEYAIAPSDPNVHYFVAANANGCLRGVFQSIDKGQSFERIIGPSQDAYDFLNNGSECRGTFSNVISVYPNNPYMILIGGYNMFRWEQSSFPPAQPNGSLFPLGTIIPVLPNFVPFYKHGFYFANDSTLYIATDGGISRSTNINEEFTDAIQFNTVNFEYTTSQYFSVGVGPTDLLIGGTQGNGTNIVGFDFNRGMSAHKVVFGTRYSMDGFDSDLSNLDPSVGFGSMPFGQVRKISGIGNSLGGSNFDTISMYLEDPYLAPKCGSGQCGAYYYTASRLWESFYDTTSKATVEFDLIVERGEVIPVGTTLEYSSLTNDIPLYHTTTTEYRGPSRVDSTVIDDGDTTIYPLDTLYTITATDYVQSVLAVGNIEYDPSSGENNVWITRHAIHGNAGDPTDWIGVAGPAHSTSQSVQILGQIITLEFSNDGNHLFVGTTRHNSGGGDLYRVSGINDVYTDEDGIQSLTARKTSTSLIASFGQGAVTGIAVDPNNAENLIITLGNYGHNQYVYRSKEAISATFPGTFFSIMGSGATALPNAPAYDAMIDYHNSDTVLVGTDFGVYSSHNAFSANPNDVEWTYENSGLPVVPVYEIRQQTFGMSGDSSRGITNTGEIYIATHGRGLYRSGDLVGIDEILADKKSETDNFRSSLNIYPNPTKAHSNFSFELPSSNNVAARIYNIHGKLVKESNFGKLASGSHSVKIDAQDLSTGTYILQLVAGEMTATGKFVIQK